MADPYKVVVPASASKSARRNCPISSGPRKFSVTVRGGGIVLSALMEVAVAMPGAAIKASSLEALIIIILIGVGTIGSVT